MAVVCLRHHEHEVSPVNQLLRYDHNCVSVGSS
jgi:hypothetical protein